ncbi:hypothetical protein [Streptomyces sp. CT34]|uniref:hypothetical protein n=1 Tax=Streptomyces sp. CT34 TaxID=1553907 RepID=UPI000691FF9B|nr:hypothetical protein [Streptomyces sp. CT34]
MTPRETATEKRVATPWRPTWSPNRTHPDLPALTVVHDHGDDYAFMTIALAAHTPARGRITVHPTPVAGAPASLAHDLLRSMGKHLPLHGSPEAVGWAAQAEIAWRAAAAWISALRIGHLVVTRTHRISSRNFEPLFALRELTGIRLTLLCHGPLPPALAAALPTLAHEQVHTLAAARHVLAATEPHEEPAPGRFAWWEAAAQFSPHPTEPCFLLPTRRRLSRADTETASRYLGATVLPLPASGRFTPEPDEHTLLLAHRLHARIAHPVHAAALALHILTGRPQTQLPGPTAPPSSTRPESGRPTQPPSWAADLIEAADCFKNLDRPARGDQPLHLSGWDQTAVTEAARACALHEPPAPAPRSGRARRRPDSVRPRRTSPTTR